MNYSKEQRENIEKVKTVFQDYIKHSKTLELLWSDKLGYILIMGINKTMDDISMDPIILEDAETLCYHLLYEIACDVLEAGNNYDDIFKATAAEKDTVKKAFHPYMVQLPEYAHLIEELFMISLEE